MMIHESPAPPPPARTIDELTLADLEAIRLVLRGGSVIDWHRLNYESREQVDQFLASQEIDLSDAADWARAEAIKVSAISYLRRNFDFPIPKPVANADIAELILLASGKGHRQLCACTILKVMHIIHHLEARELLFMLPVSDQEVFHLVEQKVYRVVGGLLAQGFPILEFIGGRKNKDSLYTKLLSKQETIAAQIYDKMRFRIVTRTRDDIFPTVDYLMRFVFPFNYIIPGESTNTLLHFRTYCQSHPHLRSLLPRLQISAVEDTVSHLDNYFSAPSYRVVHFVADMPVRMPQEMLAAAPPTAWPLGRVIFVQTEFQIIDEETEQGNELGDASHQAYKERQKLAVMRRLKLGLSGQQQRLPSVPPAPKAPEPEPPPAPRTPRKSIKRRKR